MGGDDKELAINERRLVVGCLEAGSEEQGRLTLRPAMRSRKMGMCQRKKMPKKYCRQEAHQDLFTTELCRSTHDTCCNDGVGFCVFDKSLARLTHRVAIKWTHETSLAVNWPVCKADARLGGMMLRLLLYCAMKTRGVTSCCPW